MPDHDQYFKQLLQAYFGDLVRIVAPDIAAKVRSASPTFLENELFTDVPEGEHRRLDLVARVDPLRARSDLVLIHVEVEAQARSTMGRRLFDYAMQLWLRHHDPIVSVVIYLRGGEPDVTRQTFRIAAHGKNILVFRYVAFGLSRSKAADYLKRSEPLAWALAALMRHRGLSSAKHRLACLRPLAQARIDDARKFLLKNFIDTYVQLDPSAREEYDALLADGANLEVAKMELTLTTTADRLVQQGVEQGKRDLLFHQLTRRFGPLPEAARKSVESLSSEELSSLAERVLDARSLDDLGL